MADVKLQAVISAKDEATRKLQSVNATLGKVGKTLGVVGVAAAAAGIAAAGIFLKKSIDAAKDEQVATAKVNAILNTLTGNFEENKKAIEDAADAAMKLGFDDEDASIAMAKFLQVTKNTTTAQKSMKVAMDLSRLKGIGLDEATQALTMAMQGSGRILKQLGIDVPDNADKMEVLGLVYDKVKGQAEEYGDTAAGAQDKFKVALENLQEKVGNAFLPMFKRFVDALTNFVTSDKFQQWIDDTKVWIETKLIPAIENAVKWFLDEFVPAVKKVIDWIKENKDTLIILGETIIATIGIIKLMKIAMDIKNAASAFSTALGMKGASGAVSGLSGFIMSMSGPLVIGALVAAIMTIKHNFDLWKGDVDRLKDSIKSGDEVMKKLKDRMDETTDPTRLAKFKEVADSWERTKAAAEEASKINLSNLWSGFTSEVSEYWKRFIDWVTGTSKDTGAGGGGGSSARQFGGSVLAGRPYLVGEKGPELFVPSQSGSIVPNNKMGSSININFNNPVVRSDADLQQIIAEVKRVLNRGSALERLRV